MNKTKFENQNSKDSSCVRKILSSHKDAKFAKFYTKLEHGAPSLGVKIPKIRELVKEFLSSSENKDDFKNLLNFECMYNEEYIFKGVLINLLDIPHKEKIACSKEFVKEIVSWSACDTFCEKKRSNLVEWKRFCDGFKNSSKEFEARFYFIFFMKNFLKEEFLHELFESVKNIQCNEFYAKVGAAWALCEAWIKFEDETYEFLHEIDNDFIKRKAISKICDSLRVDSKSKNRAKSLR